MQTNPYSDLPCSPAWGEGAHSCTQSPISETFEDPPVPSSASSLTTLAVLHSLAVPQTYEAYSTPGPLHEPFSLEHTTASSSLLVWLSPAHPSRLSLTSPPFGSLP